MVLPFVLGYIVPELEDRPSSAGKSETKKNLSKALHIKKTYDVTNIDGTKNKQSSTAN